MVATGVKPVVREDEDIGTGGGAGHREFVTAWTNAGGMFLRWRFLLLARPIQPMCQNFRIASRQLSDGSLGRGWKMEDRGSIPTV